MQRWNGFVSVFQSSIMGKLLISDAYYRDREIPAASVPIGGRLMQNKRSLSSPATHTSADHPPLLELLCGSVCCGRNAVINQVPRETPNACGPAGLGRAGVCSEGWGSRIAGARWKEQEKEPHQTGKKEKGCFCETHRKLREESVALQSSAPSITLCD